MKKTGPGRPRKKAPPKRKSIAIKVVADNIKGYRAQLGISQMNLAKVANVQPTYVGNIEREEKTMRIDILWKLGEALGIEPHLLLLKDSYKTYNAKLKRSDY